MRKKSKNTPEVRKLSQIVEEQTATIQTLRSRNAELTRENRRLTDNLLDMGRKHIALQDMIYEACRAHNQRQREESRYAVLQ